MEEGHPGVRFGHPEAISLRASRRRTEAGLSLGAKFVVFKIESRVWVAAMTLQDLITCVERRCCEDCGNKTQKASRISHQGRKDAKQCGVGILFTVNPEGALQVSSLLPGSPAEESGLIRPGDILHKVDDKDVFCSAANVVHQLVVGPEGSWVLLGLRMGAREGDGLVHVALQRRPIENVEEALRAQSQQLQDYEREEETGPMVRHAYGAGAAAAFLAKSTPTSGRRGALADVSNKPPRASNLPPLEDEASVASPLWRPVPSRSPAGGHSSARSRGLDSVRSRVLVSPLTTSSTMSPSTSTSVDMSGSDARLQPSPASSGLSRSPGGVNSPCSPPVSYLAA